MRERSGSASLSRKTSRESSNDLDSLLLTLFRCFFFLLLKKNFKEALERLGSGCLVNIREHLEILQHQPCLNKPRVKWLAAEEKSHHTVPMTDSHFANHGSSTQTSDDNKVMLLKNRVLSPSSSLHIIDIMKHRPRNIKHCVWCWTFTSLGFSGCLSATPTRHSQQWKLCVFWQKVLVKWAVWFWNLRNWRFSKIGTEVTSIFVRGSLTFVIWAQENTWGDTQLMVHCVSKVCLFQMNRYRYYTNMAPNRRAVAQSLM